MSNDKPKRSAEHLKPYWFGRGINKPGRPKDSRDRKTKLTIELLQEALILDPETGKRMTRKQLMRRLSKETWKSNKVLLDIFARILGPSSLPQTVNVPVFVFPDRPEQQELDTQEQFITSHFELPSGDHED